MTLNDTLDKIRIAQLRTICNTEEDGCQGNCVGLQYELDSEAEKEGWQRKKDEGFALPFGHCGLEQTHNNRLGRILHLFFA